MIEAVPYFAEEVKRVLGPHLGDLGFTLGDMTASELTYLRGGVFVSFSHWPEDQPSPSVGIGIGLAGADGSRDRVALWRATAENGPAREYTSWRFHDRKSLESLLERVATEVFPVASKVWDSEPAIEALLADQADEAETQYLERRRRGDLLGARRSFDEQRFQEAIDRYALLGPETLSAADKRQLHVARKTVRSEGGPWGE